MSLRYDFDPSIGNAKAPYRNNPNRYLLQAREREQRRWSDYKGRPRTTTGWTRWRTVRRFNTEVEVRAALAESKRTGLAQWRATWGGKVLP